jgi:hypothetical protein
MEENWVAHQHSLLCGVLGKKSIDEVAQEVYIIDSCFSFIWTGLQLKWENVHLHLLEEYQSMHLLLSC